MNPEISVLIPCYNAEKSIVILTDSIISCLSELNFEIILINDGSMDNTQEVLLSQHLKYPKIITCIDLDKNYGEFNAIICGMNYCIGNYVVILDDDYQQNPKDILKMYAAIKKLNADIIYANYFIPRHNKIRNYTSFLSHFIINVIYFLPLKNYISSFKMMKYSITNKIINYKGPYPFIDGLALNCTRRINYISVEHNYRQYGKSNYSTSKLFNHLISILASHSIRTILFLTFVLIIAGFVFLIFNSYFILVVFSSILTINLILIKRYIESNFSDKLQFSIKSFTKKIG